VAVEDQVRWLGLRAVALSEASGAPGLAGWSPNLATLPVS